MKKMKKLKKRLLPVLLVVLLWIISVTNSLVASATTTNYYTYSLNNDGTATITDCSTDISGKVVIPETIDGYTITVIGDNAFNGCTGITSIKIPDTVTTIKYAAFKNCKGMTEITMGSGVTSISGECGLNDWPVFDGCTGLKAVCIWDLSDWLKISFSLAKDNPLYYAKNLYLNGELVTDLVIPDEITSINPYAFYNAICLETVTAGEGLTSIGSYAFYGCSSLKDVVLTYNITIIGDYAFYGCNSLAYIYYDGTENDWSSVSIGGNNAPINSAEIHMHCFGEWITEIKGDCIIDGLKYRICDGCGKREELVIAAEGHISTDGYCAVCGTETMIYESEHDYASNSDISWVVFKEGASQIIIRFSEETSFENKCDYLYIYDKSGNLVGEYTGTDLTSKYVKVNGDYAKIRLVSDSSVEDYGFYAVASAIYTVIGDLDGNGNIEVNDLITMRKVLLGVGSAEFTDVNQDGETNIKDLIALKKLLAEGSEDSDGSQQTVTIVTETAYIDTKQTV